MFGEPVRDWTGRVLGFVETDKNGNQTVRNFGGKVLAYYNKNRDWTTDFAGKVLSRGNTAISYIYLEKK